MYKTSIFIIIFFLTLIPTVVFAQSESSSAADIKVIDIAYEKTNPDNTFNYLLKRFQEKFYLWFSFWSLDRKSKIYTDLTNKRLAELKYVIEKNKMGVFEKTTQRYYSVVGEYVDFLKKSNKVKDYSEVKQQLRLQILVLEELQKAYNPATAEWRFVQDDINYVKGYIESLN